MKIPSISHEHIVRFGKGIINLAKWLWKFSGLEFVYRKFNPADNKLPTGPLWLFGIYFSIFSFSTVLYQNRVNTIDGRIDVVMKYASEEHYRMFFKELKHSYNMQVPVEPQISIYTLLSPIQALIGTKVSYLEGQSVLRDLLDEVRLDFAEANLIQAELSRLDLSKGQFKKSIITLANLNNSNFLGANFISANLAGTSAKHSNFSQADFTDANLTNSTFKESYFLGATFVNANFMASNLSNSFMRGVKCKGADFSGADLTGVDFTNADLREVKSLNYSQLSTSVCLAGAKLDDSLQIKLKQEKPELFECELKNHRIKSPIEFWGDSLELLIDVIHHR